MIFLMKKNNGDQNPVKLPNEKIGELLNLSPNDQNTFIWPESANCLDLSNLKYGSRLQLGVTHYLDIREDSLGFDKLTMTTDEKPEFYPFWYKIKLVDAIVLPTPDKILYFLHANEAKCFKALSCFDSRLNNNFSLSEVLDPEDINPNFYSHFINLIFEKYLRKEAYLNYILWHFKDTPVDKFTLYETDTFSVTHLS
jgi:hypothetical protein